MNVRIRVAINDSFFRSIKSKKNLFDFLGKNHSDNLTQMRLSAFVVWAFLELHTFNIRGGAADGHLRLKLF